MALTKHRFKTKFGLNLEEEKTWRRKGEDEKREKEEEEEKKKRREVQARSKVWNFGFLYGTMNSCMNFHTIA